MSYHIYMFPREEAPIRTGQNGVKRDDREEGEMVSFVRMNLH